MAIPKGWKKNTIKDVDYYDAQFYGYTRGLFGLGAAGNLLVRTNPSTGNYQVYERTILGDALVYTYNASDDTKVPAPNNISTYNGYFTGDNNQRFQLVKLHKAVRESTNDIAKSIVTPQTKKSLTELEEKPGYTIFSKSAAKVEPSGDSQGGIIKLAVEEYVEPSPDLDGVTVEVIEGGLEGEEIIDAINSLKGLSVAPPVLRYPLANLDVARELGITYDYIKIQVVDYVGSLDKTSFISTKSVYETYSQNQKTYAYVILPMQPNISASNSTSWGEDSANILQLVAGSIANKYFQNTGDEGFVGALKQAGTNIYQAADQLVGTSQNLKSDIAALLAGYLTNTSLIQRATGSVINPNMEMLFNGPRLRSFNFSFDMTPRFKEEAEEIRKIIKVFKKYMAPRKDGNNAFLKAPKIFLLNYIYNGDIGQSEIDSPWPNNPKDHPYLNKIKPCALTNFDVNYTPSGSYMTYSDGGSMTTYQITMTFSEIEPVYDNDIDLSANNMGY